MNLTVRLVSTVVLPTIALVGSVGLLMLSAASTRVIDDARSKLDESADMATRVIRTRMKLIRVRTRDVVEHDSVTEYARAAATGDHETMERSLRAVEATCARLVSGNGPLFQLEVYLQDGQRIISVDRSGGRRPRSSPSPAPWLTTVLVAGQDLAWESSERMRYSLARKPSGAPAVVASAVFEFDRLVDPGGRSRAPLP